MDPPTFTLIVCVEISPCIPRTLIPLNHSFSPRAVWDRYTGIPDAMFAPTWTKWPVGVAQELRMNRGDAAHLLLILATTKPNLQEVGHHLASTYLPEAHQSDQHNCSIAMVEWAYAVSVRRRVVIFLL